MRGDICRSQKLVPINHEQATQAVRLLNVCLSSLIPKVDFQLITGCIFGGVMTRFGANSPLVLPIKADMLWPIGTFKPKEWHGVGLFKKTVTVINNIIRAVFEEQVEWTCTKLPNTFKLGELLEAMEPGRWRVGGPAGVSPMIYHISDQQGPLEELIVVVLYNAEPLRSEGVKLVAEEYHTMIQKKRKYAARYRMVVDAIGRLNCFLPWLIRLAGGKVRIE